MKKSFHNRSVRKLISIFSSVIVLLLLVVAPSYAHHRAEVLAETTTASELNFPPVTYGPGYILPDSPLYFLDQMVQGVKIAVAFTPEQKAKVHAQIAGERMAELRLMFNKDNKNAINTTLGLLEKELNHSSENIKEAAAAGKDVKAMAKFVNEDLKTQREILSTLSNQATGDLKYKLEAARETVKEAKIKVEDELPVDELEKEIKEDLEHEVEHQIHKSSDSAKGLERAVDILTNQASQSAERQRGRREEALRHAIETRNDDLLQEKAELLDTEEKNQERLVKERKEAAKRARESVEEVKKVSDEFRAANKKIDKIIDSKESPIFKQTPQQRMNDSKEKGTTNSGPQKPVQQQPNAAPGNAGPANTAPVVNQ